MIRLLRQDFWAICDILLLPKLHQVLHSPKHSCQAKTSVPKLRALLQSVGMHKSVAEPAAQERQPAPTPQASRTIFLMTILHALPVAKGPDRRQYGTCPASLPRSHRQRALLQQNQKSPYALRKGLGEPTHSPTVLPAVTNDLSKVGSLYQAEFDSGMRESTQCDPTGQHTSLSCSSGFDHVSTVDTSES